MVMAKAAPPPLALVQDDDFLPALLACSDTATKVPLASFQIDR
jgi:hypothetical protein